MYYLLILLVPASGMYKAVPTPIGFGCMKLLIIGLGFGDVLQTYPASRMLGFGN
jgi:hypothetical protein